MGQYHVIVNLDKHEFLNPWDMGEGAKLLEWGYGSGTMLTALSILLAVSNGRGGGDYHGNEKDPALDEWVGRWGGDRIAVVGDYAEDGDLPAEHNAGAIWWACSRARDGQTSEERIAEYETHRATYGDDYVDRWIAREHVLDTIDPPYRNISAEMRSVIEADGMVRFTIAPSGYVSVEDHSRSLRPDVLITNG